MDTAVDWLVSIAPKLQAFEAEDISRAARKPLAVYLGDKADARLMLAFERNVRHARGFGRAYQRGQFERAFVGVTAQEAREVGAA